MVTPVEAPPSPPIRTWKPTTAGVLTIVAGALSLLKDVTATTIGRILAGAFPRAFPFGAAGAVAIFFSFILSIVAIVGGIFALRRRVWWLALTGAANLLSELLGIPAIIFVSMAKQEFE